MKLSVLTTSAVADKNVVSHASTPEPGATSQDTRNESSENKKVRDTPTVAGVSQNASAASKPAQKLKSVNKPVQKFRFVNNSATTMKKPRHKMKASFKIEKSPVINQRSSQLNQDSLIIEQTFDKVTSNFINTTDQKYIFQVNMKRPPGRPRKIQSEHLQQPKVKRPQGRPRKSPLGIAQGEASNKGKTIPRGDVKSNNDKDGDKNSHGNIGNDDNDDINSDASSSYAIDTDLLPSTSTKAKLSKEPESTADAITVAENLTAHLTENLTEVPSSTDHPKSVKRGRGRPRKNTQLDDPASFAAAVVMNMSETDK